MRSKKISISPWMLIALVAVFMIASVSASTAANSLINGKKIKKGTIAYSALSKDAKKQLAKSSKPGPQGAPGPAGAAAPTYWAMINQDGGVARSTAGVSSTHSFNGGFWQYRVTFPRDVSSCGYAAATSDPGVVSSLAATIPTWVSASRSDQGANIVAVNVWAWNTGNSIEDSFFLGVYC